jgi:GNAT superfamily N-acetyltransferase
MLTHTIRSPDYGLPASYLMVHEGTCVGHARLSDCFEGYGGAAAAVTYVVMDTAQRGKGLGTVLMQLLEAEAKRLG